MASWIDDWPLIGEPLSGRAAFAVGSGGGYLRQLECEAVAAAMDRLLTVSALSSPSPFDDALTILDPTRSIRRPRRSAGRRLTGHLAMTWRWLSKAGFCCTLEAMGSEVTGAIAGLVGAAFGAGAAMWGSLTAARTQLRLNRAQLQASVVAEEIKIARGAYADFLRAGIQFELAWRSLLITFREGTSADERDRLYARVIEVEHNRWMYHSVVLLEAPEPVVALARELTAAYVELDTIGEAARRRLVAEKDGSTARWPEFDQASSKCSELTAKFAEGAKAARAAERDTEVGQTLGRAGRSRSSGSPWRARSS